MKFTLKNIKPETILLASLILLLILLRIPSLFEPHWYADEGLYTSVASAIAKGSLLYKDIWTTQPPGIISLYFLANLGENLSLLIIKGINLLSAIGVLIFTYKLTKKLFKEKQALYASLICLILLSFPFLEANIASFEIFLAFFLLAGIYLILDKRKFQTFFAGIVFAVAILFSLHAVFSLLAILLYLLLTKRNKNVFLQKLLLLTLGIIIPLGITLACFALNGVADEFFHATITYPLENLSQASSLGFIILPNTLLIRTIITFALFLLTINLYLKNKLSKNHLLIALWTIATVYAILLYQNTYTHYLIQIVPIFAIITSLVINKINQTKSLNLKVNTASLYFLAIAFVLGLFTHGGPVPKYISIYQYYLNFYKYLTGRIDTVSYTQSFGENTHTTYRLVSFLGQNYPNTKDIYVWTDNPWVYHLADLESPVKYLISYEAKDHWGEIKSELTKNAPHLIIIDENSCDSSELNNYLEQNNYQYEIEFEGYQIYLYKN